MEHVFSKLSFMHTSMILQILSIIQKITFSHLKLIMGFRSKQRIKFGSSGVSEELRVSLTSLVMNRAKNHTSLQQREKILTMSSLTFLDKSCLFLWICGSDPIHLATLCQPRWVTEVSRTAEKHSALWAIWRPYCDIHPLHPLKALSTFQLPTRVFKSFYFHNGLLRLCMCPLSHEHFSKHRSPCLFTPVKVPLITVISQAEWSVWYFQGCSQNHTSFQRQHVITFQKHRMTSRTSGHNPMRL